MYRLAAAGFACATVGAGAAPQITEFAAINGGHLLDGDGSASDWIEIHNPDGVPLEIGGYHLTDDPAQPMLYTFPAGTLIPVGGYLTVFASGRVEANYTDGAGNLHTNFSLKGSGEYLSLRAPDGSLVQEFFPEYPAQEEDVSYGSGTLSPEFTFISQSDVSTWLVPGSNIGNSWQLPEFDDAGWNASGVSIGYGYNDLISAGGDTRSAMWFVNASVYQRIPFQVEDASAISSLLLSMRYEDGFVAYLNGVRVASANAPAEGSLTHTSSATSIHSDEEAVIPVEFDLSPASLVDGTNILAIHGLNRSSSGSDSSDFLMISGLSGTAVGETSFGYFLQPTPGEANVSAPLIGFVKDTKFSHDRGYFTEPFDLAITSATPGAVIIYTVDGTPPSESNGMIYTGPVTIDETTALRAIATKNGYQSSNVDTQTYLFVEDIVRQTRPSDYPSTWSGARADYDMDPEVVDDPAYADLFDESFAAMPTLSLVFDPDAFFDSSTGIYQRPMEEGVDWERPTSAEFFLADGSEPGFQLDAGVRVQGGSSRNPDTPKHSLSLRFRSEYGAGKLRYPLYENSPGGETAVEEFDVLQLRPEYNFGWMHRHWYQAEHALYGRDQWASDLFNKMGQNGSHGRWVHLFLNGIYWGLYDLHERPDADHMANYYGGQKEDYDTVNSSVATNGDLVAFNEMMDLAYGSITSAGTYAAIQEYLDVDAFIDYMVLNAYVGNRDWDGHNWRAARKREPGAPYLFFPWDTEFAASHVGGGNFSNPPNFETTALNTNVLGNNGNRRPTGLQQRLALNAEYRLRYADRVRAHFFNGGALTPAVSSTTWTTRSALMHDAVVAESARWGDFRRDVNSGPWSSANFDLYTRDDDYLPMNTWLVGSYIPQRSDIVLSQLRNENLYPDTDAPDFSQYGGVVAVGYELEITGPGTIYYTTDGSDPRLAGGSVNGAASVIASGSRFTLNESTLVKARTRAANNEWSALTEATFTIGAGNLVISEIMYNPLGDPLSEFLEITNAGAFPVSLTGLRFTDGLQFEFDFHSAISAIPAGGRILLVRDLIAFRAVYGSSFDAIIAGEFQGDTALSDKGERLTISNADNEVVLSFRYEDKDGWPEEADGNGYSLVYAGGNAALVQNWRPSVAVGGNPGASDSTPFTGGDLTEYAVAVPLEFVQGANGLALTFSTNLTADDAVVELSVSSNLFDWEPVSAELLSSQVNGNQRVFALDVVQDGVGFARLWVRERSK
ncbi:MAG: lamin tail domain-containing protein [Verrucomicrobiaceae bacterium]